MLFSGENLAGCVVSKPPQRSKVPRYNACRVSMLGIATLVLGKYLSVEYLGPQGNV